jgi:hypothetical protein
MASEMRPAISVRDRRSRRYCGAEQEILLLDRSVIVTSRPSGDLLSIFVSSKASNVEIADVAVIDRLGRPDGDEDAIAFLPPVLMSTACA